MSTAPPSGNRQSCATATSILELTGETAMSGSTSVSGSQLPWDATVCWPIWPTCKTPGGPDGTACAGAATPRPASAKAAPETMSARSGLCTVPPGCLRSGRPRAGRTMDVVQPPLPPEGTTAMGDARRAPGTGSTVRHGVWVFSLPSPDRFVSYSAVADAGAREAGVRREAADVLLPREMFARSAVAVAPALLGC